MTVMATVLIRTTLSALKIATLFVALTTGAWVTASPEQRDQHLHWVPPLVFSVMNNNAADSLPNGAHF